MSRCFPYPPPGYTVVRSDEEAALIESIKLQKEREKAKAERKEEKKREKKERKERKKERKEKEKQNLSDSARKDKSHKDKSEFTSGYIEKKRSSEADQLERSNLTEEYGQPVYSQNPNNSSDSTQNSNKRKRISSPPNVTRSHGNVIRIRLSSQKNIEYVPSASQNDQICSTSGRIELPVQRKCETASSAGADNICSTSQQAQNAVEKRVPAATASLSKRVEKQKPMHKDELQYRKLIENWVPSSLNELVPDDDQDWLFKRRKQEDTHAKKKSTIACTNMLCSSSALFPRANYLQEVEIFALPYTIPF